MEFGLWMLMLVCNLLLPLVFIGLGQKFTKDPPKTIDPMYGYRTVMSMKNQDTWEFAQAYYGRTCYQIGWVLLSASMLFLLLMWRLRIPCGVHGLLLLAGWVCPAGGGGGGDRKLCPGGAGAETEL